MSTKKQKKLTGDDVFRSLMDLDLLLQDVNRMISLKLFLASISPNDPSLIKLDEMILGFHNKIFRLSKVNKEIDL